MKKVLEHITAALAALTECKAVGPRADSIRAHLQSCASNAAAEVPPETKPEPKPGKTAGFGTLALLAVIACVGMLLLFCLPQCRADSFSTTNSIAGSTTITSFPTNTAGMRTGRGIDVRNNEHAMFYWRNEPVGADATNNVTVTLLRSAEAGSPTATFNSTNGSFTFTQGWETLPTFTLLVPARGTNTTYWVTNLSGIIGDATYIGIYSIANGHSAAITNFECGIGKKIIPIRYP